MKGEKIAPLRKEIKTMQTKRSESDTELRGSELEAELAGILTAISIVSKRLAKNLTALGRQDKKGGPSDTGF